MHLVNWTKSMTSDMVVNVHEAKTHLSRLLEQVSAGRRVTIARAGTPIADLVPHHETELVFGTLELDYSDEAFHEADDEVARLLGSP